MTASAIAVELPRGFKTSDVGVIPSDWEVKQVGAMGDIRAGKALAAHGPGQLRPYLRTKNVFDGRIDIEDVLQMPMTDADFARYRLRHGDVLLNEGQSIELVGRCAMYKDEYPQPCAIQNQLVRFRAREGVSAGFCAHLFRYCQLTGVFTKIALQTTSVAHLGVSRFQRLELAWPNEESEQSAIAEALDDADLRIESLEDLISKKRWIKQGAMQELLTGRSRLPGFAGDDHRPLRATKNEVIDLGPIPDDWAIRPLADVGRWFSGGTPSMKNPAYWSGTIPWVSPKDMKTPRILDSMDHITEHAVSDGARLLPTGAVLMVIRGMILAHSLPVARAERPVAFNQDMKGVVALDGIDSNFLFYWLTNFSQELRGLTTESTHGTKRLPPESLYRVSFFAPPSLDEQEAIAAVLVEMEAEITALESKLSKALWLKQAMTQELLTGKVRLV